jgi:hypothetical protein
MIKPGRVMPFRLANVGHPYNPAEDELPEFERYG